jgi:hypothetical protein
MNTYVILRRSAWKTPEDLEEAARCSTRVGNEEMPDKVRWIRSYVVEEETGALGTVCIYQGVDADAIREHAHRAGMPADEVIPVRGTVLVRPDPPCDAPSR